MPTINVTVPRELADFVAEEIATGQYRSASEIVGDALRLLQRQKGADATKLGHLREEVGRGFDQADAGQFSTRSLDELAAEALGDEPSE